VDRERAFILLSPTNEKQRSKSPSQEARENSQHLSSENNDNDDGERRTDDQLIDDIWEQK